MSRVRIGRIARLAMRPVAVMFLAPIFSLLSVERVAYQDVAAMLIEGSDPTARARMTLVAAHGNSEHKPSFTFRHKAKGKTMAAAVRRPDGALSTIDGLSTSFRAATGGTDTGNVHARINRGSKGDRLITITRVGKVPEIASGEAYRMASLLDTGSRRDTPRVAFVKPKKKKLSDEQMIAAENNPRADDPHVMLTRNAMIVGASMVSAYAPEITDDKNSPFALLLGNRTEMETIKYAETTKKKDKLFAMRSLPAHVVKASQQKCLAEAIYFEARSEPWRGQVSVAQVVLNRVRSKHYPNTICGVVYQNKHRRNRCQFSFACDGKRERVSNQKSWDIARDIAREIVAGQHWQKDIGPATHYHATYVNPRWARSLKRQKRIGRHIFYKFPWAT